MKQIYHSSLALLIVIFNLAACNFNREAVPISFGTDQCDYCRMTIANPQFGAELITDKGRVLKYDATECMVNNLKEEDAPLYQKLYVVPFDEPKELKPVEDLHFLISPDFRSPMGANLSAFSVKANLEEKYHSQLIDWHTLLKTL